MNLVTLVLACSVYSNNSVVNAIVEQDSQNNPLMISGQLFKTPESALGNIQVLQKTNSPVYIGLMQIPNFWLDKKPVTARELLNPCKNMVFATQLLNKLNVDCNGVQTCVLSEYKTGDKNAGLTYANHIMQYASDHPFVPPAKSDI